MYKGVSRGGVRPGSPSPRNTAVVAGTRVGHMRAKWCSAIKRLRAAGPNIPLFSTRISVSRDITTSAVCRTYAIIYGHGRERQRGRVSFTVVHGGKRRDRDGPGRSLLGACERPRRAGPETGKNGKKQIRDNEITSFGFLRPTTGEQRN